MKAPHDRRSRGSRRAWLAALFAVAGLGSCTPPAPPPLEMGARATLFPAQEIRCQDIVGELYRNTSGREVAIHLQVLDTCRQRAGQGIRSRFTVIGADGATRRQEYIQQLGAPTVLSFVLRPEEEIRLDTGGKRGEGSLTYVLGVETRPEEAGDGRPRDVRPGEAEETSGAPSEATAGAGGS